MARLRKLIPDAVAILVFALIGVLYFWTPVTEGLVLTGTDHNAALGSNTEIEQHQRQHGERTRWTNSLFCGMPTYQMSPSYDSTRAVSFIQKAYSLWLPQVVSYVFLLLLGFYIMLRAFDFRVWLASLGAVLWAFSSYYFIIIAAGHIWKLYTLCFIPPTIGGLVLCYRGRWLRGIALTGLFSALQVISNHVQMTYYFLFVVGLMVVAFLADAIRQKQLLRWAKGTGCALLGALLGVAVNASNLYHTYQYSKETMRGGTELSAQTKDAANQTSSGLERSYITAWSYGIDETWTLLIPNAKGGASVPLSRNKDAMAVANKSFTPLYQQMGQYWGEQPGTSGPVYVGAFCVLLFILALFVVKGPMKWALLAATVLSLVLSWGKNFMPATDWFLDHVPMYDKFRTVASILVIAEFTMPLLAIMALRKIVEEEDFFRRHMRKVWISFALVGGACLVVWLMPDMVFGSYISSNEQEIISGLAQYGWPVGEVANNLTQMRRAMLCTDAARSLVIVMVGMAVLLVYKLRKIGPKSMVGCLIVLCLMDMWGVNRRYLSDESFSRPRTAQQYIPLTTADEIILQDTDPYYRVLNLSVSTFNDNTTSFRHKSIGGYHAAKLRRYQELIEAHITPEIRSIATVESLAECRVLNMLNMRYLITNPEAAPVQNPYACGNAWFVDEVKYVDNADAELSLLGKIDTHKQAVSDRRFEPILGQASPSDSTATARLTHYSANELHYEVESQNGGVLVMSDIYYPGWTCTVDGEPVEIGRVDYVLRAIKISKGRHELKLIFKPSSVETTETISYISLALLLMTLILAIFRAVRKP